MTARFRRSHGEVTVTFDPVETEILRDLLGQLLELVQTDQDGEPQRPAGPVSAEDDLAAQLDIDIGTATTAPADPALARLFPDAYADDAEAAGDFRRFTERGLREAKRAAATQALDSLRAPGVRLRLDDDAAHAWLGALNDLRLTLGTRLGVTEELEETYEAMPEDDPLRATYAVYLWLGWLQETLVRALR